MGFGGHTRAQVVTEPISAVRLLCYAEASQSCVSGGSPMSKFALTCLFALALQWLAPEAAAQFSTTVPGSEVAAVLEKTFSGTIVNLHNKGKLTAGSYHLANASSIKIPASVTGIPGQRTYFTLPDESRVFLGRRYGYYVDRLRSNGLFVTAGSDTFTFSITLAAPGPALVGTCVRLRAPATPCATLGEDALPPIDWRDARIDIIMKPIVLRGSITLDVQDVVFGGTFDVGMACSWPLVGTSLCAALNKQSQRTRVRVAAQVKAILNSDETRAAVAAGVREYLDTTLNEPLLRVRRVSMVDGTLTIGLGLGN